MKTQAILFKDLISKAGVLTDRFKEAEQRKKNMQKKTYDDEKVINDTLKKITDTKNHILSLQNAINDNYENILIHAKPTENTLRSEDEVNEEYKKIFYLKPEELAAALKNRADYHAAKDKKRRSEFYKFSSFYICASLMVFVLVVAITQYNG